MTRRGIIVLLMVATCCISMRATSFDTQRLERLAGYLNLQKLDTLPVGTTDTYHYRQHPLTIRKNQWGEIDHIGLKLFPESLRRLQPLPVYDFLERYLLARMATPDKTEDAQRMQWEKVNFNIGNTNTALTLDTTAVFSSEYVDLHVYRVSWTVEDKTVLQLSFNMDYQLLTGCDAVELEHRFIRHLSRYQAHPASSDVAGNIPADGTEYTRSDSYYMSPMVRNDIYYTRKASNMPWTLVEDASRATKTINNWMIAPESNNALPLVITIDKYGYEVDSLRTTYRVWQQLCMEEGCLPYYGLKSKQNGWYEGTVFMVNKKGGYVHLLSIDIPEGMIKESSTSLAKARMYAYIPLYNVSAQLLHNVEYESIK